MAKPRRVAVAIELEWLFNRHMKVFAGCQEYSDSVGWDCKINAFADRTLVSHRGACPYDGVIGRVTERLHDAARSAGVPVVNVMMNSSAQGLPGVFPDFKAAGAMAARHLLGRGFRHFGFMGCKLDVTSRLNLKGFRSTLKDSGFSCTTHRYHISQPYKARTWDTFVGNLAAWVDTWTPPIGIYVTHDLDCRYLIDVFRSKGLNVPRDVAVIGSGNEAGVCASPPPALTSIDLSYTQVGYQAASLLDRLMDGEKPPAQPLLIAPRELIPRQSTDSYAVDDPLVARALRFIAEHGHHPIGVDDVVKIVPTTLRSLQRRFHKTLKRTIGEEILRLRLERAKRRLVETDEPLKNVWQASGFNNRTHFYRAFVRLEGISPKAYRQHRRQEP
ncbi:MAG: substrate-binding domain-containing protein [Phycisphaerales bacterium]|jgi:LacI family transcriptional regulator|nr:substrate-binding domain-containing protein [Phycisphaerales bacterium]